MKVKICGLKTQEQVDTAVAYGASYLGFVFAESKRQITAKKTKEITKNVPEEVKKVGVFVSPSLSEVERIIQEANLDIVQIHGTVPSERFSVPLIRAIPVDGATQENMIQETSAEFLLFDAPPKQFVGGNGEVFDWQQLDTSSIKNKKIIIAGGLTPENVQKAKRTFNPYAVDVSSGVETNGEKDLKKIIAFLRESI
ncbi:phosphoribosylanthranilate isomerase [Enterococcus plantarum]|uniref:N-(5'-phosphoribosyl)anthranilate isomerase n=1 Tax=Enterococcus plantarum TaxID=1077675 RepID=A0A2W4A627_9ENTE|nr:phosphoribosylanthranilate isomerase [Enterococcus plantarum]MBO0466096.1 phosphoribosylanthranilate isomerase [Enterococcus plantarum]PZL76453.1 phosphoribosylanthranilate isomerase [Enterococcus plantarum]